MDFETHFQQLSQAYLQHLANADLAALLQLFAPAAEVLSPLYGRQPATDFYRQLFSDTNQSKLQWKDTLVNKGNQSGCIFFEYSWTLATGEVVRFDVIDYVQLIDSGQINFLQIVYDTVQSRPALDKVGS
ncbi:MAG: nuclear transport factor 2 family protein [Bacteroidota bacterium]